MNTLPYSEAHETKYNLRPHRLPVPTLVTYVIAVVSLYMGFQEVPPIMNRKLYSPTNVIFISGIKLFLFLFLFNYTCSIINSYLLSQTFCYA